MARGRFIVFEGIDGSGKSSTLQAVAERLSLRWPDVVTTREETEGATGGWVRQSIQDAMEPLATAYLFLADRAQHVPEIEAHLDAGRHVLCDRYKHSTLAYQSVTLQQRVEEPLQVLERLHAPIALEPDHVVWFRADPATCVARTRARGVGTPYEKVEFLRHVQAAYERLAQPDWLVVDAQRPQAEVVDDVARAVEGWLSA